MKKIVLILSLGIFLFSSCGNKNTYTVSGSVTDTNLENQKVYLQEVDTTFKAHITLDSTTIKDGKFEFKGEASLSPQLRFVALAEPTAKMKYPTAIIVEKGEIALTFDSISIVKGTPMNVEYQAFLAKQEILGREIDGLESKQNTVSDANELTALLRQYKEKESAATAELSAYIKKNISNELGVYLFARNSYLFDADQLKDLLSSFGTEVKTTSMFAKLELRATALEATKVGVVYTDLKGNAPDGREIKLSDYVGNNNYVLVDFWASWCPPCRRDMPNLAAVYAKYKDKGFTIVGVSLDSDKEAWAKGISNLNIAWPQLSDLKGWGSELSRVYGVASIPHTVLIDRDGKIIARGLHGKEVMMKLDELIK